MGGTKWWTSWTTNIAITIAILIYLTIRMRAQEHFLIADRIVSKFQHNAPQCPDIWVHHLDNTFHETWHNWSWWDDTNRSKYAIIRSDFSLCHLVGFDCDYLVLRLQRVCFPSLKLTSYGAAQHNWKVFIGVRCSVPMRPIPCGNICSHNTVSHFW